MVTIPDAEEEQAATTTKDHVERELCITVLDQALVRRLNQESAPVITNEMNLTNYQPKKRPKLYNYGQTRNGMQVLSAPLTRSQILT